ncbi:MAG: hypothetical protein JOY62_06085 [Acidobacteriaceae bacterium]|nr:hypothetical protein [Acidobacteriaceae bacterium]MBV9779526.1 hypothetical protein [Acidobacteriaceae bacterium]
MTSSLAFKPEKLWCSSDTSKDSFGWGRQEDSVRSGSLGLDAALGTGGLPTGRLVEIYGKYDTGKTTLALAATAQFQKKGQPTAYLDVEHKLSKAWAKTSGVNVDQTMFIRCGDAFEALRTVLTLVACGEFSLVVVDSLAALVLGSDIEQTGAKPSEQIESVLDRALPRIAAEASKSDTCVLLLNQVRTNYEELFGNPLTTPGGHVLRHACSIRIELARHLSIKRNSDTVLGQISRATITKNTLAPPWQSAKLPFTSRGLDECYEAALLGRENGIFCQTARGFEYAGTTLGKTELDVYDTLLHRPELTGQVLAAVRAQSPQSMLTPTT